MIRADGRQTDPTDVPCATRPRPRPSWETGGGAVSGLIFALAVHPFYLALSGAMTSSRLRVLAPSPAPANCHPGRLRAGSVHGKYPRRAPHPSIGM